MYIGINIYIYIYIYMHGGASHIHIYLYINSFIFYIHIYIYIDRVDWKREWTLLSPLLFRVEGLVMAQGVYRVCGAGFSCRDDGKSNGKRRGTWVRVI